MIVSLENIASEKNLKNTLERAKTTHSKKKKPNLAKFFGILPNLDDGLKFQKKYEMSGIDYLIDTRGLLKTLPVMLNLFQHPLFIRGLRIMSAMTIVLKV